MQTDSQCHSFILLYNLDAGVKMKAVNNNSVNSNMSVIKINYDVDNKSHSKTQKHLGLEDRSCIQIRGGRYDQNLISRYD